MCKMIFSSTVFRSIYSSVHEECSFEKTVPRFLRRISQHLLLISRKCSKNKKCWENVWESSTGDAKCNFDNNAEKTLPEVPKISAPTPEIIKNYIFNRNLSDYEIDKRTRGFRKIRENWGSNPKKLQESLFYSTNLSPRNDPLYT